MNALSLWPPWSSLVAAGARQLWDVPAAALAEIEKQMETP